jgi:hypothetical protein
MFTNVLNSGSALVMDFAGREHQKRQGPTECLLCRCNSREPEGMSKITTATRSAALEVANDFLKQGMRFVTVVAQGRLYTPEEFATTTIGVREQ